MPKKSTKRKLTEEEQLIVPPTEIEVANLIKALSGAGFEEERMVARRLAYQRDYLFGEMLRLNEELGEKDKRLLGEEDIPF